MERLSIWHHKQKQQNSQTLIWGKREREKKTFKISHRLSIWMHCWVLRWITAQCVSFLHMQFCRDNSLENFAGKIFHHFSLNKQFCEKIRIMFKFPKHEIVVKVYLNKTMHCTRVYTTFRRIRKHSNVQCITKRSSCRAATFGI